MTNQHANRLRFNIKEEQESGVVQHPVNVSFSAAIFRIMNNDSLCKKLSGELTSLEIVFHYAMNRQLPELEINPTGNIILFYDFIFNEFRFHGRSFGLYDRLNLHNHLSFIHDFWSWKIFSLDASRLELPKDPAEKFVEYADRAKRRFVVRVPYVKNLNSNQLSRIFRSQMLLNQKKTPSFGSSIMEFFT